MYSNHHYLMAVNRQQVFIDREEKHEEYQEEIKSLRVNIYETEENSYLQSLYNEIFADQNKQRKPTFQAEMEMQTLGGVSSAPSADTRETHLCGKQKYEYVNSLKEYLETRLMTLDQGLDTEQVERVKLVIDLFKTLENDDIRAEFKLLEESKIRHLKGFQTQTMYNLLVKRRSELTELALAALLQSQNVFIAPSAETSNSLIEHQSDDDSVCKLRALQTTILKRPHVIGAREHSNKLIAYIEERGTRCGLDKKQSQRIGIVTELLNKIKTNDVHGEFMLLQEEAIKPLKGIKTQRLYDILVERRNFLLESAIAVLETGIQDAVPRASCSHSFS